MPASRLVWALAGMLLLLHLLTAGRYGIFRDEMYGLACARHLDWGYVDHPPGGIVITWIAHHLFGDSLQGLRLLPALAGAVLVLLTGRLVRELGGGGFAQVMAALAVCFAPYYLILDHLLMMNAFEPLIWMGCLYCVIRATRPGGTNHWFGFGVLAGIGFETKYSIAFLVVGVLVGLALSPQRRQMADWRLWAGLAICGAIALPNFLWQWRHGFPFLEFRHNVARNHRDIVRGPVAFILDQMVVMGPLSAPLWIIGAIWLLAGRRRAQYAVLGWTFLVVLGLFIALKGKNYYVSPVYPIVFAGGAVALEQFTEGERRRWLRVVYPAILAAVGLVLLPLAVPILPPEALVRYEQRLGIKPPEFEHQKTGLLPQYFADEFGWEEMVREVARIYHTLPPEEQGRTLIFSNSWGAASAVDFFGPKYGLPHAVSKNNSYWLWGPGDHPGDIVIVLHTDGTGDRKFFASVEKAGHVEHPWSRRDEWYDIYVCRGPKFDFRTAWSKMKTFD
ncbi:MAG TPA: glycosyltransferase family 39 protein [Bryobacterales bacterium]|nr:glycosyltransferase family 39 protein [Bryobacterales bacterium]